nr:MAG TPA: hypothetical protein [Caudoviricetes sp.]
MVYLIWHSLMKIILDIYRQQIRRYRQRLRIFRMI